MDAEQFANAIADSVFREPGRPHFIHVETFRHWAAIERKVITAIRQRGINLSKGYSLRFILTNGARIFVENPDTIERALLGYNPDTPIIYYW